MAYVVGSASVEIVPDFRNAQRAITAFFAKQGNELKVPINPEVDQTSARRARDSVSEVQRQIIADRKSMYRQMFIDIERQEKEATRVEQQQIKQRQQAWLKWFDDLAKEEKRSADNAIRERERATKAQVRLDGRQIAKDNEHELGIAGRLMAAVLGETIVVNSRREIRARAGFLSAVISGILIAGAPAAFAGATALFGGIGLAATASSNQVKVAWTSTWQSILADTRKMSAPFIQVHQNMAEAVRAAFVQSSSEIATALRASAPLVEQFTNSLLRAAQSALPGIAIAIERAGPAMAGLGEMLVEIGQGVGAFFDEVSEHSAAAGTAAAEFGEAVSELLPTLGDLLGLGAEVASTVLPLLTGGFSLLRGAIDLLGPVLPVALTGLLAFRAAGHIAPMLRTAAQNMAELTYSTDGFRRTMAGGLSTGLSKLSSALPILAIALSLVGAVFQESDEQATAWAQAIRSGGAAADQANRQMNTLASTIVDNITGWKGVVGSIAGAGSAYRASAAAIEDTSEKLKQQWEAMGPLQQAQAKVTEWTNTLAFRQEHLGRAHGDTSIAAERLTHWSAELAQEQARLSKNIADTVPSTEAAKQALENYQILLANGDTANASLEMARYKAETAEATREQQLFNIEVKDLIPAATAARNAQEDWANAIARNDMIGAAQAAEVYRAKTVEAARDQELWNQAIYGSGQALVDVVEGFVEPLDTYRRMMQAKSEEERKAAEDTAKMTQSTKDSWRDYVEYTGVSLDEYARQLEDQLTAQENWRTNIGRIAEAGGIEVAQHLADMGIEGSQLVQDMVDAIGTEEFPRLRDLIIREAAAGSQGAAREMEIGTQIMAIKGREGARATATGIASELRLSLEEVLRISQTYGLNLASGLNPMLVALGRTPVMVGNGVGRLPGQRVANAEGNLWLNSPDFGRNDRGDHEKHIAQIAPAGAMRVWAEPETGGEAYIPLAPSKRPRAVDIWRETGRRLNQPVIIPFAWGGINDIPRPPSETGYGRSRPPITTASHFTDLRKYEEAVRFFNESILTGGAFGASGVSPNGVGGLGPRAAAARAFVMATWGIRNIGGYANRTIAGTKTLSDHALGKAIDVMLTPDYNSPAKRALGNTVASHFVNNAARWGTKYVIYYDRINSGRGWGPYGHPGGGRSDTLQHRDHVHVSFYKNGTAYVPSDRLAYLHRGEAVMPADVNEGLTQFSRMLGTQQFGMPSNDGSLARTLGIVGSGGSGDTSVVGFQNNGTVVVSDEQELMRQAEISKRATLVGIGLIG